jgi:hypothetical protein
MALLQIGGNTTNQAIAAKQFASGQRANVAGQAQAGAVMNGQAMAEYYRNLGQINAGGYADANATTIDLLKTTANLGIGTATAVAGA